MPKYHNAIEDLIINEDLVEKNVSLNLRLQCEEITYEDNTLYYTSRMISCSFEHMKLAEMFIFEATNSLNYCQALYLSIVKETKTCWKSSNRDEGKYIRLNMLVKQFSNERRFLQSLIKEAIYQLNNFRDTIVSGFFLMRKCFSEYLGEEFEILFQTIWNDNILDNRQVNTFAHQKQLFDEICDFSLQTQLYRKKLRSYWWKMEALISAPH